MSAMSYYHKPRTNPLDYRTLHQILDENTAKHPDKESIVFYNEKKNRSCLTFQQLKDQSTRFAASLLKLGLKRGDRVLLYAPNSLEFVVCWMALTRLGVCAVLMCPGDVEREEVDLLKRLKCTGLICGLNVTEIQRERITSEIIEIEQEKNDQGEHYVKVIITFGEGGYTSIAHSQVRRYENLMEENIDKTNELPQVDAEDVAFVCFTSGSTGDAKAVAYTHHQIINGVNMALPPGVGYDGNTRAFSGWPISWGCGAPVVVIAIVTGFTYITSIHSQLTIDDSYAFLFHILKTENCSGCSIPQQHVHQLLARNFLEHQDVSNISSWGFGSQIVPRKTIQSLLDATPEKKGILVYASTEVLTVGIQPLSHESIKKKEDYGKMYIFPDIEVKIINDEGLTVPLQTKGEICARGPKMFLEYLEDPEGTSKAKSSTGWVHTGDYGIMYNRARIKVLGRKMDLIDTNNHGVFPVQVEEIIIEHPDVLDVIAVGIPGCHSKEDICACVIQVPGSNLEAGVNELHEWCEQQYCESHNEKPSRFLFLKEFPISDGAKIDRRAITRMAREMLGL